MGPGVEQIVMCPVIAYPDCVVVDVIGAITGFGPLVEVSGTDHLFLVTFGVSEVPDFLL